MDFNTLQRSCHNANAAQWQMMGMYSAGPFTRVRFGLCRGEYTMQRYGVEPAGTLVSVIGR